MLGKLRLYHHLSGDGSAASAARHLHELRKQAFTGAKIRTVQRAVGIDDADQG